MASKSREWGTCARPHSALQPTACLLCEDSRAIMVHFQLPSWRLVDIEKALCFLRCRGNPEHFVAIKRDVTIDGLRAVAALGVVFAHLVSYRLAEAAFPGIGLLQRLAEPLAQTSVQIFFVISGYIITTLLLKEEADRGRFSIPAFYVRRFCRIIPPLVLFYAALLAGDRLNLIRLDGASLASAATFTCNMGFVDCQWWVAHTWSLSVEEQFYVFWPALLLLTVRRADVLAVCIALALVLYVIMPFAWHSNYISFSCIGLGALWALSPKMRAMLGRCTNGTLWVAAIFTVVAGPLLLPAKLMQAAIPLLVLYIVFATRELAWPRKMLALPPIQWIGAGSYSLYLWQQVFLAKPDLYVNGPFPRWFLPIVVLASVMIVERPFIKLGRKLSARLLDRNTAKPNAEADPGALPAP